MPFGVIGHFMVGLRVVHRGVVAAGPIVPCRGRGRGFCAIGMGRRHANARHRKGGDRESQNGDDDGA